MENYICLPRLNLLGSFIMGLIFSFEKLSLVTSFWRGKGYLHTPPRFDSLLDLHSFPRPGYWMATHPRHPAWCCKWWGETRRSCCWARRCRRRICCCSGCRSLFPRAARIRWRTKLHSHTSELLYPLQVWFLGWWRTSFHLETQTKGIRVPKQINGINATPWMPPPLGFSRGLHGGE